MDPPSSLAALNLNAAQQTQVAELIASIQGLTMKISLTDKASGEMTIDFGKNVKPIADIAKNLTLEVMAEKGASIPDIATLDVHDERSARSSPRATSPTWGCAAC
jgi:hypothetical protein